MRMAMRMWDIYHAQRKILTQCMGEPMYYLPLFGGLATAARVSTTHCSVCYYLLLSLRV